MLIDGRVIAQNIINTIDNKLLGKKVCFILFGNDTASLQFIRIKTRTAERLGIEIACQQYTDNIDTETACQRVSKVCNSGYDGVIVQLPLPIGLDAQKILDRVPMDKDIDVLSTENYNLFKNNQTNMIPPVAAAVWEILQSTQTDWYHKNILIIGHGDLVGRPVSDLLSREGVIHTIVDHVTPRDEFLREVRDAEVIISGTGVPHLITPEMISHGVILIDAGTSEQSGELVGDIHPGCADVAGCMTPVPGGAGPVTVACVYKNLMR
jgi:methylenetetrahydrofolate dehydrogenase (NADP+) / methenyltetrahydrofolate cyclohydrolase